MRDDTIGPIVAFGAMALVICTVLLFRFLKARMRHKEILAAIEKGVALPELTASESAIVRAMRARPRTPRWIANISLGIAFLIISPVFIVHGLLSIGRSGIGNIFPTFIFFGIGACLLIRGLLLRKHEQQAQLPKASQ